MYGREPGVLKGTAEALLLNPPVTRVDDHFALRDRSDAQTLEHIRAENEYTSAVYDADATWRSAAAEVEKLLINFSSGAPPHEDLQQLLWYRGADKAGFEYAERVPVDGGPHAQYLGL